jgi:hypothetical protein|tara:strand:+ start:7829 stop:8305 length:477 start_codon:yes stop_codon:yes gene_type:complete
MPNKKRNDPEHQEQIKLISRCRLSSAGLLTGYPKIPELGKIYSVPNGGLRTVTEASKLKNEGVRAGVLDLALDTAHGGFFGLKIEMKAPGKITNTSDEQDDEIEFLDEGGYCVRVCDTWQKAWEHLLWYVSLPNTIGTPAKVKTSIQKELSKLIRAEL